MAFNRDKLSEIVTERKNNRAVEFARETFMRFNMETDNPAGQRASQFERMAMLHNMEQAIDAVSEKDIKASFDQLGLETYKEMLAYKRERKKELEAEKAREWEEDRER